MFPQFIKSSLLLVVCQKESKLPWLNFSSYWHIAIQYPTQNGTHFHAARIIINLSHDMTFNVILKYIISKSVNNELDPTEDLLNTGAWYWYTWDKAGSSEQVVALGRFFSSLFPHPLCPLNEIISPSAIGTCIRLCLYLLYKYCIICRSSLNLELVSIRGWCNDGTLYQEFLDKLFYHAMFWTRIINAKGVHNILVSAIDVR